MNATTQSQQITVVYPSLRRVSAEQMNLALARGARLSPRDAVVTFPKGERFTFSLASNAWIEIPA